MKKRIKSKDMEVGRKVLLAFRDAVPDDGVTIRQAVIGAELFIAECFANILEGAGVELVDAYLKELMEAHDEHLEIMTQMFMVLNRKKEKEGVSDAEEELRAGAAAGGEA